MVYIGIHMVYVMVTENEWNYLCSLNQPFIHDLNIYTYMDINRLNVSKERWCL